MEFMYETFKGRNYLCEEIVLTIQRPVVTLYTTRFKVQKCREYIYTFCSQVVTYIYIYVCVCVCVCVRARAFYLYGYKTWLFFYTSLTVSHF